MQKNVAGQKITVYAWDVANGVPKTGDAGNITAYIWQDSASGAVSNDTNPTELDATNAPGLYVFDLTQGETNADEVVLYAVSSTADISIKPAILYTKVDDAILADTNSIQTDTTAIVADTNELQVDWTDGGRLDLIVDATLADTNAIETKLPSKSYLSGSTDADGGVDSTELAVIADGVWDEILTGATHNITNSAGRRLRDVASPVIISGTSPGGGGNQSVVLDNDASAVDGTYDPGTIIITGGTGVGQSRQIMEYDGSTKMAYLKRDWKINPDETSTYTILASAGDTHVNEGIATAGDGTSITLNALASGVNSTYVGQTVFLVSGTGQDQARTITAYNGTTKVATVATWQTNPSTDTVYIILPIASSSIDDIFGRVVEGAFTYEEIIRLVAAYVAGDLAIAGGVYTYTGLDDATERLVGTIGSSGRVMSSIDGA